ncbi:heme biosynthesis HemY N-terminal domain-containing protein [Propionivibrio limicola]|uniref:heme biosynthesis HemY N-terminal domain-containing protein n=1 Tax=Propionivibrio limicola TaxID=167645 RepID=UPI0012914D0E|nr:heme biosynthesis HemY N-terminal domain-containing protein [Propionivibrio limicola]
MKGLLWVLALFAAAVALSLAAYYNEGYLLLVYPPYRVEISLNLAIVVLVGGFVVMYGLLRGVALTMSLPGRVREFRARRQREKMTQVLDDGVRLLVEGRYAQAMKRTGETFAAGFAPATSALLAARAAQRLRESEKQKQWLEKAVAHDPKAQAACLMLEAEMLIETHRFAEAAEVLKRLHATAGRHIAALRLELRAQQGCGNWDEVLRLARVLEKRNALVPELAHEIKLKAHQENVRQRSSDLAQLRGYLKKMPSSERSPRLARVYAEALVQLGEHEEAGEFIKAQLEREWDSRLAGLYGQVRGGDLTARIAAADKWLPAHRDDPQLLLALGRMCFEQRLWGKAQAYLEAALSVAELGSDKREIRLELARLFETTERVEEAMPHYRAAAMAD